MLQETSGDANPPLPPAIEFGCVKRSFQQKLDHFNPTDSRTFGQAYWVCADAFPDNAAAQVSSRLEATACSSHHHQSRDAMCPQIDHMPYRLF